ncbi:MAG TPA: DUF429 domain-containing protein [Anaerolineales bacterium]|nr:DUF429 domain-containing protein [Anaerolineales bacterium]
MLFVDTTFIGIDLPSVRRPLTYAALDSDLNLVGLGHGSPDDVLAYVIGQRKAFVAVNSPRRASQGFMAQEAFRDGLRTRPKPGRWDRWRVAEYELRLRRIKVHRTPMQAEKAPGWIQIGFSIFNALEAAGFRQFVPPAEQGEVSGAGSTRVALETNPHAAFTALLKHLPFARTGLEGRIQRQLALYINGLNLPDPMQVFEEITRFRILNSELVLDDLLEPTQLDAAVAAYTAWSAAKGEFSTLGHPDEGQVVLPVRELLPHYD